MYACLIIASVITLAVFVAGLVVGMCYEQALRRLGRPDARRVAHLEASVRRYLDAEDALCTPRSGSAEQIEFRAARRGLAKSVDWEPPAPMTSNVVQVGAVRSQELAS